MINIFNIYRTHLYILYILYIYTYYIYIYIYLYLNCIDSNKYHENKINN